MTLTSSEYVNNERRGYSLYTLSQRAIPHASDGLKAAARRVMWTARNGKAWKSASLAGATMPIHPHASPEGTINTLAGQFSNNIPLLTGEGGFGTILNPTAFAASRYTSVSASAFANDVLFRDIEIIPMQENYDGTLEEPEHFLPLVPLALLNPQEGIAVGFACSILPRSLDMIIGSQLEYLEKGTVTDVYPAFVPTENPSTDWHTDAKGAVRWTFEGAFEKVNATTIRITRLPYGIVHAKYMPKVYKLEDAGVVTKVVDDSVKKYDIIVTFKKGYLRGKTDEDILKLLSLYTNSSENLNLIDFDGNKVIGTNYVEMIERFTAWRLEYYLNRYQRLADLLAIDIQRYLDILNAIKNNVGGLAPKFKSRTEMKEFLVEIGVVHIYYIADLSIYRFTEDEKKKTESRLKDAQALMKQYQAMLKSPTKRKELYKEELKEVLAKHKKGAY